jgi:methionine-rich copper-binding protein CopC
LTLRKLFLASLLAAAFFSTAAAAHTFLDHATPAADAVLSAAPAVLVLVFTDPVDGDQIKIELFDGAGRKLASNMDKNVSVKDDTVTIPLHKLDPGDYRVTWFVNPRPGHETSGDYHFKIEGKRS